MFDKHSAKPLRLTLVTSITTAVIVAVLGGIHLWSAIKSDIISVDQQAAYVQMYVNDAIGKIGREQQVFTLWNDAASQVEAGNFGWVRQNLVDRLIEALAFDQATVIAGDNIEIGLENPVVPADAIRRVARLTRELIVGKTAADAGRAGITDLVQGRDGAIYVVSAKPIVRQDDSPIAAQVAVHVAVALFDKAFASTASNRFFTGRPIAHGPDDGWAQTPLYDNSGTAVGYLDWEPHRPGQQFLTETGPVLLVGVAVIFLNVLVLMQGFRRASKDLESSKSEAEHLAFHDHLTSLPNRILFDDRLRQALLHRQRGGWEVAIFLLDLDEFKQVNDTLGHPAGDELIRQIARRLQGCLRGHDTIARLGGDEFAVICPRIQSTRDVHQLSRRMIAAMAEPFLLNGDEVVSGVSIGVSVSSESRSDPVDLLRSADVALYQSKDAQRGTYRIFTSEMDEVAQRRRMIETDLRAALADGDGLHLAYQPLFSPDGDILGAEALVRWTHPVHGNLPPDQFIRIAEERGIIVQLGQHILEEACRFAASSGVPWVAVNVSPVQLRRPGFAGDVIRTLEATGLSPRRVQIEVTEGVILDSSSVVMQSLRQLRDYGIRVSLDDFGTGYSSMSYLRRFELDKLKIDRSFVRELGADASSEAIVQAIITIARSLGMTVTAEGVETQAQHARLSAIGCDELQGYYMARPMSGAELEAALASNDKMVA